MERVNRAEKKRRGNHYDNDYWVMYELENDSYISHAHTGNGRWEWKGSGWGEYVCSEGNAIKMAH